MKNIEKLIWLLVAIALGMGISYLYTGWPIIAISIGPACGVVTAFLFLLIDIKLSSSIKNVSLLFRIRLLLIITISLLVFAVAAYIK